MMENKHSDNEDNNADPKEETPNSSKVEDSDYDSESEDDSSPEPVSIEEQRKRKYEECEKFVKKFQTKLEEDNDEKAYLTLTVKCWDSAAEMLARYKVLKEQESDLTPLMKKTLPYLYERGERNYKEGIDRIGKLSAEDKEEFWKIHSINKDVELYDNLKERFKYLYVIRREFINTENQGNVDA